MNEYTPLNPCSTKRLLSPNVISLISIGSTIGTGLFFLISSILIKGPLVSILSFTYISFISLIILLITKELSCLKPDNGSLCQFQSYLLSRSIGLANNLIYWLSWCFTLSLELSILYSLLNSYLSVPYYTSIITIWFLLTLINLLPVNYFGLFEVFFSLFKLLFLFSWLFITTLALFGINPHWEPIGFSNWFANWPTSFLGPLSLSNLLSGLIATSFTFQSIESIALTSGELQNPSPQNFNKIIKLILFRIIVFYLISLFILTLLVPYNDPDLSSLSSPFLIALKNSFYQTSSLLSFFNFIIFTTILSAANSNIYFGSRSLIALVESSNIPHSSHILKTVNGVPYISILLTSFIGLSTILLQSDSLISIFNFLLSTCASAGLLMWCLLLFSYIRFCHKINHSNWLYFASWFSAINIIFILLTNGIDSFSFSSYLTPLLFFTFWGVLHFFLNESSWLIPIDSIHFI